MTSKVTVEAQSQPCEIRLMPRVGDNDLWESLSAETKRFAEFVLPAGEKQEYFVHSGQSVMVREWTDAPGKAVESNNRDELRATPESTQPGRYLLRGDEFWAKPYEAELLEWSAGGRLKLGAPGSPRWLEGHDIPFVVERIASVGRNPEGEDPQGLRAEHEHAVPSETSADAQTPHRDESGNATSGNPLPVKK